MVDRLTIIFFLHRRTNRERLSSFLCVCFSFTIVEYLLILKNYNFWTISNLSLKPIDSFFGSYFLRAANLARSSFALIFKLRPLLVWLEFSLRFPLPWCCDVVSSLFSLAWESLFVSWVTLLLVLPPPFSRVVSSLEFASSFVGVAVAAAVLPLFDDVSFDPIDLCIFWKRFQTINAIELNYRRKLVERKKKISIWKKKCQANATKKITIMQNRNKLFHLYEEHVSDTKVHISRVPGWIEVIVRIAIALVGENSRFFFFIEASRTPWYQKLVEMMSIFATFVWKTGKTVGRCETFGEIVKFRFLKIFISHFSFYFYLRHLLRKILGKSWNFDFLKRFLFQCPELLNFFRNSAKRISSPFESSSNTKIFRNLHWNFLLSSITNWLIFSVLEKNNRESLHFWCLDLWCIFNFHILTF